MTTRQRRTPSTGSSGTNGCNLSLIVSKLLYSSLGYSESNLVTFLLVRGKMLFQWVVREGFNKKTLKVMEFSILGGGV